MKKVIYEKDQCHIHHHLRDSFLKIVFEHADKQTNTHTFVRVLIKKNFTERYMNLHGGTPVSQHKVLLPGESLLFKYIYMALYKFCILAL